MALVLDIKVVPQSGKQKLILAKNGTLKCFLKNPPERGAANKELIEYFAHTLCVPQASIEIIGGLTNRKKRVKIHSGLSLIEIYNLFDLSAQSLVDFACK